MLDVTKLSAAFTKFMRGLTMEGIVLTAILGAVALVMYALYLTIPEWGSLLWRSEWARILAFTSLATGAGWAALTGLQRRMSNQLEQAQERQQIKLDHMDRMLQDKEGEIDKFRDQLQEALILIARLETKENECRSRVETLKAQVEELQKRLGGRDDI